MNDTHIGFLLMSFSVLVASAISRFRRARRDEKARGMHWYVVLAIPWCMGMLAAYPSFVARHGNSYILFALLMIALAVGMMAIATFVFWVVGSLFTRATRWYGAYRAVY